jgi:hypothetical protein
LKGEKEMDIFGNVNLQVVTHSTGIKKLTNATKITNGAAAKAVLERMAAIEEAEEIDKQALQSEKDYDAKKQTEKVVTKQINDNQKINKVSEVYHTGKNIIFKEILFEVFKKSLYLDTEFIQENWENLRSLTDSYVDSNGGIKLLEAAVTKTGSPLLKNVLALCENVAKAVCQRKLKKANECDEVDDILNFDLEKDEEDDLNYEKQKLGIDELADMVKQKVLTVVQDEKSRQQDEDELYGDIENQLSEDDNVNDENSVEEALNKIFIMKNPIEESTLFDSLLRSSYKEVLENIAIKTAQQDEEEEDEKNSRNASVNSKEMDIMMDEHKNTYKRDIEGDEPLVDDDDMELGMDNAITESNTIDMDMVMAEALTKYTLMETLYTLMLENYTTADIQKMSQKMLFVKK